jgi:hypothetical protein
MTARQEAGGRLCPVRADLPGPCRRHRKCVRPRIPGLSPGGLGPHLTSSGFPVRAFLRFPVCPPGSSPSPAFPWFPFVRRSPVRSLRPLPGSGSPSVSLRVTFPSSNLHVSAAARAIPEALVPGGRDQGHQFCNDHLAWIARSVLAAALAGRLPGLHKADPSTPLDGRYPVVCQTA